ncbi:5-amino-6-(5-phospho-D-ribitylamino)uracil phosphatase YigB [Paraburkholderia hiiakae]|uniref:5-amino-6-(5-phospho-D-ribitylamino)uracil phosphatase YigB n=1 Tax=Paraburkholderia hiiakae TaxID=1081782 RepID=A0ABM8P8E0_9BURK|nr:HAD family hydrolase [Paraburkholderia hiiakae]CAD6559050.1 5-amino-6-(5-phospho-D-ribitylamino)uracil phosphatase YigB [Paraburkholderia hiiakae]
MRLSKVSAISFDLDDTLWSFGAAVERAEAALHSWLVENAPKTADVLPTRLALAEIRDAYERSRPDLAGDFRALRVGSITRALELAKEDVTLTDPAYETFYAARQQVEFFEDVLPALKWLSARFPLVAVTNGNADLRLTGGSEFFQATVSASSVGIAKPQAEIFHAAARVVGVPPAEILHVGDDLHLDVLGALDAGLQAAWLVRMPVLSPVKLKQGEVDRYLTINDLSVLCRMLGGPSDFS